MSGDDGFTLVKYKRPKQNILKKPSGRDTQFIPHRPTTLTHVQQFDSSIDYIKECKTELKSSPFYIELLKSLSEVNSENGTSSEKVIESVKFYDFVCYGIGKISESPNSRYQLALLLLLWQYFSPPGKCYVYDPVLESIDEQIIEHFELTLISRNEEAKRKVSHKTFFFVPHGGKPLYNNILWSNWGTGLDNVVIFGNSFSSYNERIPLRQLKLEARYIAQILPFTHEVGFQKSFHHDDIFNDMSLHSFEANQLCLQPLSFWNDCEEPTYEDNNTEIILNVS